ncbi:MAG TPA: hypothetical protein DIT67_02660 [Octadecabacter sp.]|nr:hypothetical protein [Octadecabacter sp.]
MTPAEGGPARFLCVGTHHKTGTVWLRRVLHEIKRNQDIPLMQCHNAGKISKAAETGPQIIVNWESKFPKELLALPHARFIHMIRDPRDVLLSGMRYHRKAPLGRESFLADPRDDLAGKSYQEHLNALPDDLSRWQFEMRNKHAETVDEMLAWDYSGNAIGDVRYEDLIVDVDCVKIREILEDFAIEGLDIDKAVQAYWQHSLFGGVNAAPELGRQHALHITSGSVAQWKTQMPRALAEIYADEYGDALISLGYEDDKKWVKDCPVKVKP